MVHLKYKSSPYFTHIKPNIPNYLQVLHDTHPHPATLLVPTAHSLLSSAPVPLSPGSLNKGHQTTLGLQFWLFALFRTFFPQTSPWLPPSQPSTLCWNVTLTATPLPLHLAFLVSSPPVLCRSLSSSSLLLSQHRPPSNTISSLTICNFHGLSAPVEYKVSQSLSAFFPGGSQMPG